MTHTDVRSSKFLRGLAVAQASITMLGLLALSMPSPAMATQLVDLDVPQDVAQCVITSNTQDQENGADAFLVSPPFHINWTAVISAASWIWGDDPVVDPVGETTQTFTKTFSLAANSTGGTLEIAADNYYSVSIDSSPLMSNTDEDNYSSTGQDSSSVSSAVLTAGTHTITVVVTNKAMAGGTTASNPAGLLYKLTVTGTACGTPPPTTVTVTIAKYIHTENGDAPATGELPSFPMASSWDGGNGTYSLGPVGFNSPTPFTAVTSNMNVPADYATNEVIDGDIVIASDAACSPGKYKLLGYKWGDTLQAALDSQISLSSPNFQDISVSKHVVVINEKCPDAPPPPQNTCVMPTAGNEAPHIDSFGPSAPELTLQQILDNNGYTLNVDTDQENFQNWNGTGNSVDFSVKAIAHASAYNHVFGYYTDGNIASFVPVFADGPVPAPYNALPVMDDPTDGSQLFTVNPVNNPGVGFAIKAYSGTTLVDTYATQQSLNTSGVQRAAVYNSDANEYVLGFDDQAAGGEIDEDYQDVVVEVSVTDCENAPSCNPEEELLTNGGFESPAISASDWDIVPSGTLGLDWLVNWLNPSGAPATANAEFQKNVGWSPFAGLQYAELDSDWNGHIGSLDGESGSVSMEQTVPTVPGQTYTFSYQFSPRPGTGASENSVQATVNGSPIGTSGPTDGTANSNTVWSTQSFSFVATGASTVVGLRDAGTSNSSGSLVDNASLRCTPQEQPLTATIHAQKVICNSEAALPNMSGSESNITATTAADWVAQSNGACHLADWDFQWAPSTATNPGDNVTGLPTGWTSFIGGMASVPAGALVWVRENIDTSYIPFSGAETNSPVSAEVYCNADVLNYDNLDYVDPVVAGQHYYCVAFNAPVDEVPTDDSHGPVQTFSGSSGSGDSNSSSNDSNPEVLGESTETCEALLTDYLKIGWANNPEQVKKLQGFLAEHLGNSLPVTGFFGPLTFGAVKVFQSEDWEDILKPWISVPGSGITGQDTPTGFVYKTTKWHINNIVCPGSEEFPTNLD